MPVKSTRNLHKAEIISLDVIERRILALRGHSVMFDRDLATLYGVETRTLNQAVKRNLDRFPADYRFRLTPTICGLEARQQRQIPALRIHRARSRHVGERPQKCAAARASIQIVRAQRVVTHHILASQLAKLASKVGKHDVELRRVFLTLRAILEPPPIRPKHTIGFIAGRA
jgi:hypothetical protein